VSERAACYERLKVEDKGRLTVRPFCSLFTVNVRRCGRKYHKCLCVKLCCVGC
jgi:hypothetical protein